MKKGIVLGLAVALACGAAGAAQLPQGQPAQAETHPLPGTEAMAAMGAELVPGTTADPSLQTKFDNPNVVAVPHGTTRSELVVLLPGTGGKPAQYSLLIKTLADNGFRVIGLMYNDTPTEAVACDASGDLECHRRFREERFAGDAPKATVQNAPDEGIEERLTMLLRYLEKEHPGADWGQYLDGDHPAWRKIIVTGHSQGSGHAAYIAKTHEVARAVLFSGPYDGIDLRTAPRMATWLSDSPKTPLNRWFAEYHEKDLGAPIPPMTLAALKVPPDHIIVSHLEPDAPASVGRYHGMGTHDARMVPQWKWLFGVEGGVK